MASSIKYPQAPIQCDDCEDNIDVLWYCNTCSASLCNTCKVRKIHGKHEVVPWTESDRCGSRMLDPSCDIHPGKKVKTYCLNHKKPCCSDCLRNDHQGHNIIDIEDAYKEHEIRLNDFIKKLEKENIPMIRKDIADLKELQNSNSTCFDDVQVDINKFRKDLKCQVDQICDNYSMEVDKLISEYHSQFTQVLEQEEKHINELEKLIADCEMKIRTGGLDIMTHYPTIPAVNIQSPPGPKYVNFMPRQNNIKALGNYLAELLVTESPVACPDIKARVVNEFKANICASSIVPTGDDQAWISFWGNDTMYLYDTQGSMKKSVVGKKGSQIWDITLTNDGDILVASKDKCVRRVTTSGKVNILIDTKPYSPQGVYMTDKNEIMICMAGQEEKNHVAMYSSDGKSKECEIRASDQNGKLLLTDPARVTMSGENMHVLNLKQNVVTMDLKGTVQRVYNGLNDKIDRTFEPLGLCGDINGNLLISDYGNHCVHFVNNEGHLIQVILSQDRHGIEYPFGMGFDKSQSKLWLGNAIESTAKIWVVHNVK